MKYKILTLLILAAIAVISCRAQTPASQIRVPEPANMEKQKEAGLVSQSWEQKWAETIQAGKKEGAVAVYATSLGPALKEALPLIKNKFGLNLEISSKRGGEITTSLLAQRKAGLYLVDILISGTNTFYGETEPSGLAEPMEQVIILPEILDAKNWYGGEVHWINEAKSGLNMFFFANISLAINTSMVKPGEIKSYSDLLNAKWKGKILMNDPTISGTALKGFSVFGFSILGLDYFRQLARQEPMVTRDQRLQITWLSQGKYPILLFPNTAFMVEFIESGAPIDMILPEEGTYLSRDGGTVALVNKAPHPNAAKVMLNWIFSKEGLTLLSRGMGYQSARIDIPIDGLNPMQTRKDGVKYFLKSDTKEWVARDGEYKKAAEEIFGQYLR